MLDIRGLEFAYPAQLAMRFDLQVAAGECVALLGPSGAGKSTLLNLIAGFEQPHAGQIWLAGQELTRLAAGQRPVTTVFQEHNLFPHLSVFANVGLGVHPGLRLNAVQQALVHTALARVGLADLAQRLPGELSGGQRQRAALARVLVRRQPLLLLDEPFAALGPALRMEMLALVNELRHEQQLTVLLVSHQPDDALAIAERCAFIADGQISAVGITGELLGAQAPEVVQAYLGTLR